ncbi:MAG: P-loop NTPase [Bradymonadia bacterium]
MMPTKQVWAFGGGKGGVGKSVVCSSVAVELAARGQRVTVLDADLGGANLHTLLGLRFAERTLDDFVSGRCATLGEVRLSTPVEGLRIISGAGGVLKSAHLNTEARFKLMSAFFELDEDVLLIDLGAGTHLSTLDFFNVAGEGLVVTGPEPTAIQNAYAFLKSVMFRRLYLALGGGQEAGSVIDRALLPRGPDRLSSMESVIAALEELDAHAAEEARAVLRDAHIRLVVNQARSNAVRRVVKALSLVSRRYLDIEPDLLAAIPPDPAVHAAVRAMIPVRDRQADGPFCTAIGHLVDTLLAGASPISLGEALNRLPQEPTRPPEAQIVPQVAASVTHPEPEAPASVEDSVDDVPEPEPVAEMPEAQVQPFRPAAVSASSEPQEPEQTVQPVQAESASQMPHAETLPVPEPVVAPPEPPRAAPPGPSVMADAAVGGAQPEAQPFTPPAATPTPRVPTPIPEVPGLPAEIVAALMRHTKSAPPRASAPAAIDPWAD